MVSLTTSQYNSYRKNLKGTIKIGSINITYDLTGIVREMNYKENKDYFVCKDGKIMMYNLGII